MIAVIKTIGMLAAGVVATGSVIFSVASMMSLCSSDLTERKDATISAFWSLVVFALCCAAILTLSGCQAAKTIIDTCRDGLCR